MAGMISIELHQLRFFAAHGVYEEEAKLENEFEVDLQISYTAPENVITKIDETINYVSVYSIVKEEMGERKLLLETCAVHIIKRLKQVFPQISSISISIKKLNPPIPGFMGSVGVTYTHTWD
ncbi:MAG: dihydroneopterin aldolase [Flavisolibacter sp.]|nr:dihydroneopterin aldolase [Flavisolibacter sp.]